MRMRNIVFLLATSVLLLIGPARGSAEPPKTPGAQVAAEDQIREVEREWAQTAVTGDVSVIERILADDFIGTSPEGGLYTKQDFINEMKAHPSAFTSNHVNEVKVRFFSNAAVAQGNETFTRDNGETGRFVWTDVLVQRDGRWQVVAAEDLIAPVSSQPSGGQVFVDPPAREQDKTGIDKTRTEYVSAWKAANAERITNLYTMDAFVLYPNQPALNGKNAIREYFGAFFAEFKQEDFQLTSAEIQIVGSWAFDRGTYRWKGVPRDGGTSIEDYGKYLVILQRQTDGTWKVARDMDNSDRPASQADRGTD